MELSSTQRWTFLVTVEDPNTPRYIRAALHPVNLPPYVRSASSGPERDGKIRVEVTLAGRDRWEVQRRVEALADDMVSRPGLVQVLDITSVKGSVTRPRGYSRGYKPNVAFEVPAGPPKPRECTGCRRRPQSQGKWSQQYQGPGH